MFAPAHRSLLVIENELEDRTVIIKDLVAEVVLQPCRAVGRHQGVPALVHRGSMSSMLLPPDVQQ